MGLLEEHFAQLEQVAERRRSFTQATLTPIANGTSLVTLSGFALPDGWNSKETTVYFLIPVGYPVARPDTFWTPSTLSPQAGGKPANTGTNVQPGIPQDALWFSWHPAAWNPNRDNLINYVGIIRKRFEDRR
jgi:hypothetical protein